MKCEGLIGWLEKQPAGRRIRFAVNGPKNTQDTLDFQEVTYLRDYGTTIVLTHEGQGRSVTCHELACRLLEDGADKELHFVATCCPNYQMPVVFDECFENGGVYHISVKEAS